MLFSVVAMSCLLAVQASPLGYLGTGIGMGSEILDDVGSGIGREGSMGGFGRGGGIDEVGMGGLDRSGSEYGHRGSEGSRRGYGSTGYSREGGSRAHDRGHLDHDFKKVIESHVSEGHDSGHSQGYGSQGHERGGHSSYGADDNGYGSQYYSGMGI